MSRRIVMRLTQIILVLVLGLWVNSTSARADVNYCPDQRCTGCPATWHGSCFAGVEGCGFYGCSNDGTCTSLAYGIQLNQCYCEPCIT